MALMQLHPEGRRRLVFRRHFRAGPDRVFDRLTGAHWLARWLGPAGERLVLAEAEPRAGGALRLVWPGEAGARLTGEVTQVAPPRLIRLRATLHGRGAAAVALRLAPEGDGTALRATLEFDTPQARDLALASSLAETMELRFDQMDRMLA